VATPPKFGQPVRQPWPRAIRTRAEHERASRQLRARASGLCRRPVPARNEHVERLSVELDPIGAVGLGGAELRPVWALDEGAAERDRRSLLVDVAPSKGKQLAPTGTRRDREPEVAVKRRILSPRPSEQHRHLVRSRRADLGRRHPRGRRTRCLVQPDPVPPHGLCERPVEHAVDAGHGSRGERAVVSATSPQEVGVEVVDVRGGELGEIEVTEVRLDVAVDDGSRMAHRGSRPACGRGPEPLIEKVSKRPGPDPSPAGLGDEVLELPTGEALGAMDRPAEPPGAPRLRIGAEIDPELPGVGTGKAHRAGSHDPATLCAGHGQAMASSWTDSNRADSRRAETALVRGAFSGADDGIRTRDPHLGKVARPGPLTCDVVAISPVSSAFSFACNPVASRRFPVIHGTPTGPLISPDLGCWST
jgi:hypothetical protein